MGVSGNSYTGKSYMSFTINTDLLARVLEAVQAGEKEARTSGVIQSFEIYCHGFRQNMVLGRIFIIPASICSDRKDFPTALLYGSLVREFGGEELGDMIEKKIGESEFDEYSQADFDTIKEKLFGIGGGKFQSLVLFAPAWLNKREYIVFKFTKDEDQLRNNIRHQIFAAYYDPRVSSAFNAIMTNVDTTRVDVTDITPKINFPFLAENLLTQYPDLQKSASTRKPKIFLTRRTADQITKEVLDPQELNVFESLDQALSEALLPSTEGVEQAAEEHHSEPAGEKVPRVGSTDDEIQKNIDGIKAKGHPCPKCGKQTDAPGECPACLMQKVTAKKASRSKTFKAKSAFKIETRTVENRANVIEEIKEKMNVRFNEIKANNPQGYMDAFEAQLDTILLDVAQELGLKMSHEGETFVFTDALGASIKKSPFAETGTSKEACEPCSHATPFTNVGPGTAANEAQAATVKGVKENVERQEGDAPVGIAIDETGVPRNKDEAAKVSKKADAHKLDTFTQSYLETALWSMPGESDETGKMTNETPGDDLNIYELPEATIQVAVADCTRFQQENAELIAQAAEAGQGPEKCGHDFLLTRNGHGAGFWDGDYPKEIGEALTQASKKFGENDLYIGDDGNAYWYSPAKTASSKKADRTREAKHPETLRVSPNRLSSAYSAAYDGGFVDKHNMPPQEVRDYMKQHMGKNDAYAPHAAADHAQMIEAGAYGDDAFSRRAQEKWGSGKTAAEIKADFIADHIAADFDAGYEVASTKSKKAVSDREAKLDKLRGKQADVALDIDSIWNEITEDFGPAPVVDVDVPTKGKSDGGEKSESEKSEPKGDGRPRKSDIGKLPEAFRSDKPKEDKDSMPEAGDDHSESESDKPWHVSSSMEDFVKEAFDDMEEDEAVPPGKVRVKCDQCQMLMINGIPCHETGCPNQGGRWDVESQNWVKQRKCGECGGTVDADDPCCNAPMDDDMFREESEIGYEPQEEGDEGEQHLSSKDDKDCEKAKETVKKVKDVVKKADDVQGDVAEAKSETVSVDTVDSDIQQPTESVAEAAKVAMHFMNEYDVRQAVEWYSDNPHAAARFPVRAKAARFLKDFMDEVNSHSDGWAYWKPATQAAKQLMLLIESGRETPEGVTEQAFVKALGPIRSFYTRRGNEAGMQMPKLGTVSPSCPDCGQPLDLDHAGCKGVVKDDEKGGWKVASDISGDISEAKSEVVSPDSVDSTIQQPTESVAEAAKVAGPNEDQMEEDALNGFCPKCNSDDTQMVEGDGQEQHLFCHHCDDVTWVSGTAAARMASAGDNLPEEIPFDLGAGDLANVVLIEEDFDGTAE